MRGRVKGWNEREFTVQPTYGNDDMRVVSNHTYFMVVTVGDEDVASAIHTHTNGMGGLKEWSEMVGCEGGLRE